MKINILTFIIKKLNYQNNYYYLKILTNKLEYLFEIICQEKKLLQPIVHGIICGSCRDEDTMEPNGSIEWN